MVRFIASMILPFLLLGCSSCEDALAELKSKHTQIKQSNFKYEPLWSTIEHKIAKKQCESGVFNKFIESLN